MSKPINIPVVVESGQKYKTSHGVTAIKDGVKSTGQSYERLPKPKWLRVVNQITPAYNQVKRTGSKTPFGYCL